MHPALKVILEIQALDMKMIRLLKIRKERQEELKQIGSLRKELHFQLTTKEEEIVRLGKQIQTFEDKITEINTKIKKLESQQASIKKIDEFNALTQEMTASEREKIAIEGKVSDLVEKRITEEEILSKIKESITSSEESTLHLEKEIGQSIEQINIEGRALKAERDHLTTLADPQVLATYNRLLKNKKDSVVVPIENRNCSGCHISLTAQHENLVRRGESLIFCEHCSRIHYWQDNEPEEAGSSTRRRRRRTASTNSSS